MPSPSTSEQAAPETPQGRVLVIEDDDGIRHFLHAALSGAGYAVDSVADATDALRAAARAPPSLILLDYALRGSDAASFLAAYRAGGDSYAPVIVMTAEDDARSAAAHLGAAGFLRKPFDLDELFELVRRHSP